MKPLIPVIKYAFARYRFSALLLVVSLLSATLLEGVGLSVVVPLFQNLLRSPQENAPVVSHDTLTQILQRVFNSVGITPTTEIFLILLCLFFVLKTLGALAAKKISVRIAGQFLKDTQMEISSAVLSADMLYFTSEKQGVLVNALTTETTRAANVFVFLGQWCAGIAASILYVLLAVSVSGWLALVAATIGILSLLPLRYLVRKTLERGRVWTHLNEEAQVFFNESLSGIKLIKAGAQEQRTLATYEKLVQSIRENWQQIAYNANLTSTLAQPIAVFILSGILVIGLKMQIPFAELVMFLLVFQRLLPAVSNVQNLGNELNAYLPAFDKIQAVLKSAHERAERSLNANELNIFDHLKQDIVLSHVTFEYTHGHPVLNDLSLHIPAGKSVALIGPSGGGKTTLIDMILGLYTPLDGTVLIDGTDLNDINLNSWRKRVAYVSQETFLFHATIRENLLWDAPDSTTTDDIVAAAKFAHAHEFISQMSHGYDSIVGDRGVRLSGGQRQRLALARAILKKPALLILDEATSALDHESEQLIKSTLDQIQAIGKTTVIMIAHRHSTIVDADLIYVIEQGTVVSHGRWGELQNARMFLP